LARRAGAQHAPFDDDPRWYVGGTPPRRHNRVTPLIDGDQYLTALHEALQGAEHYVFVIAWCLTPDLPIRRASREALLESRLKLVLAATASRVPVRVLLWGGAPFLFKPDSRMVEAAQRELMEQPGVDLQCRLDRTAHFSHTHHQKAVVIDGRVAFVGGMDLTTFAGDRWDTSDHLLRAGPNWHDVQVRIEGEAAADVDHNFRQRWHAATGEKCAMQRAPTFEPEWNTLVQILRTIPKRTYKFTRHGEYGIYHAYIEAIRQAKSFVYIENQYLWSSEIVEAIIEAMNREREQQFRVMIVLPARAFDGKWDNDRQVNALREADNGRGIFSAYCLYSSGPSGGEHAFQYRPIYVHAKVMVVDDEWVTIGSANLNERGIITDSEIVAAIREPDIARTVRLDLWSEHLGMDCAEVAAADPIALIDSEWPRRASQNAETIKRRDAPLLCAVHRYECGRMPGAWLLEEAEAVTLEH
jgi:phosphatidylserine/phosphatidylglycerophosphate/cardiolipin synthase-like enzyme